MRTERIINMGLFVFLIWLIRTAVTIFWIMDILNMPFMVMFDTVYPLNGWFWFLVILLCGGIKINFGRED